MASLVPSVIRGVPRSSSRTASASVRPMLPLASFSTSVLVTSPGASCLGAAVQRGGISADRIVTAASIKGGSSPLSQPAHQENETPAQGRSSQPPMQLLLSIVKPLLLPLSAYLGFRLLAGLPVAEAARLGALALAAQLAVATAVRVTASCTRQEAALLIREQQRGPQQRGVAQAMAEDRAEAQFEFLEFKILGCWAAAATVVWHLLSAAAHATGIAAAVQSALGVGAGLPANFELDLPKLLFMLAIGPAFRALHNTWWARRSFKRAAAERRKQLAERLSKGTQQGPAAQQ